MTVFAKIIFLMSSYAPLFLLLAIRFNSLTEANEEWGNLVATGFFAAALFSLVGFFWLKSFLSTDNQSIVSVKSYSRKDEQILAYAITYFPPMFSVDLAASIDLWSLGIIYAVLLVVYIRLDAYYVNPLFAICGYRIYEIHSKDGVAYTALAQKGVKIQAQTDIKASIRDNIILVKR